MARGVLRPEHKSLPRGSRGKYGLLPEGALPRLARCCPVYRRRPGRLAIDTETGVAHLPGIAGFLRHHQRRFDGNTDSAPVWKGPSRRSCEEQPRGVAHRIEHDPEKWKPVFPRDKREAFARGSCSNKKIAPWSDPTQLNQTLARRAQGIADGSRNLKLPQIEVRHRRGVAQPGCGLCCDSC